MREKNAKWLGADYGGRTLKHEPRLEVALKNMRPLKPFEMRVGDSCLECEGGLEGRVLGSSLCLYRGNVEFRPGE